MSLETNTSNSITTFNKYGLHLRWPRAWIIILGIILIFLCLCIAGMEVGHTVFDFRRSTAFGGFILFIPFLICGIFVLITACKPTLILLRIAVILCWIMIVLNMVLIAYDILVLIDPTRCFFLNCNDAVVNASNSTTNITVSGWPLYITWPAYFQTNMNAIRIFQSIQLLCAGLFILFAALYILTYYIYRHIKLGHQTIYNADVRRLTKDEINRASPTKDYHIESQPSLRYNPYHKVTTYMIEARPYTVTYSYSAPPPSPVRTVTVSNKTKAKRVGRRRIGLVDNEPLCTRCHERNRMMLTTNYERQNYFANLCLNCNQDVSNDHRKVKFSFTKDNRVWRP